MKIDRLDHLVLTVRSIAKTLRFYTRVLGMQTVTFNGGRKALVFGRQKINLHELGREFLPKAHRATPGSADLCFVTSTPLTQVVSELRERRIPILAGPVARTGARGPITSIYLRDPDNNLVEIATYSRIRMRPRSPAKPE